MKGFNSTFNILMISFVVFCLLIVGMFLLNTKFIIDAKKRGKTLYEIRVNNLQSPESYMTTEYDRDKQTGCIKFKDVFGINRIVCNNYTITEY